MGRFVLDHGTSVTQAGNKPEKLLNIYKKTHNLTVHKNALYLEVLT